MASTPTSSTRTQRQSLGGASVSDQHGERGRVADDGHAGAVGQRLRREQQRHVEQVADGVDTNHAGPLEQRARAVVGQVDRRRLETGNDGACSAVDGDDRLAASQPAGQPGELARVAERLEVHQHDIGVLVGLPELQQVVAGHVGSAAGRDERRDADAASGRFAEDGDAQRAGLGEEAGPPGQRRQRRERRVEPNRAVGVDDAEAVRTDDAHAVRARLGDQLALRGPTFGALVVGAALAESAAEHDQPAHAALGALRDDLRHCAGRHGNDDEIDLTRYVEHRAVRRHATDVRRLGVDRVEQPVEAHPSRFANTALPTLPASLLAPTTATDRG